MLFLVAGSITTLLYEKKAAHREPLYHQFGLGTLQEVKSKGFDESFFVIAPVEPVNRNLIFSG